MATVREFVFHVVPPIFRRRKKSWKLLISPAVAISLMALASEPLFAQFQQPLVFSSGGAIAVRNDQTGALSPVSGSPFASVQSQFTLDVQGRFLFSLGTNSIHLYAITNATTGAYQEVQPGSPFSSSNTNQPTFIAVEPTGNFIAVVNRLGQKPGDASIETFQISPSAPGGPALLPVPGSAIELDSTPVGVAQPPDNKEFLIFLGANPLSQNPTLQNGSEFQSLSIDSKTGLITGLQPGNVASPRGVSFAMDPQGRYYALGTEDSVAQAGNLQIIGIGGQVPSSLFQMLQSTVPDSLWIDSTGTFLYVATSNRSNPIVVNIYSVNLQTGKLTETTSSPLPGANVVPPYAPDPTGSFNYGFSADGNSGIAYTVDPLTGYFIQTANSPFGLPQISGSLTFSIPPGQQGISGPSASLSGSSLAFGSVQTGSLSAAQTVTLTSNGGQALSVNSISVSGADPSQFQETDTCQAPAVLQPTKFCSISVTFAPTATGPQGATLVITDNAPGSPQSVTLSGTGTAPPPPAPAVSVNPNPVNFPTTVQGNTSSPITITVTNSGNATLHINAVTLGGNNASDFSMTNGCSSAYAANQNCSIAVAFTPLAAGQRSAAITLSDDAANSPQIVQIAGTATPGQPTTPLVTLSAASLSFGSATQGTVSPAQSITLTNSGGAALHISSIALAGANPGDFSLTNACTAASYAVNASCTLSVSFAPLSTGSRAATLTITDDAPNSPQNIALAGTANAAFIVGPAAGGSTAATISAGQTAQYNLQLTPGAGFTGSVLLACSGAPLAATCSLPASVQISNGAAAPFTVSVTTTGGAMLPPVSGLRTMPRSGLRFLPIATLLALLLFSRFVLGRTGKFALSRRYAAAAGLASMILLVLLGVAGCGGRASVQPATQQPPPVVTPHGTSTITVTPSANSASGKPLQLMPMQLTLTVN